MFSQVPRLQPEPVNRRDYSLQQEAEFLPEILEFLIERIGQQTVVKVPHQMHHTFLLRAFQGIVSQKEIAHKHAAETPQ